MYGVRFGLKYIFLSVDIQWFQHYLLKSPPNFGGNFLVSEIQTSGNSGSGRTELLCHDCFLFSSALHSLALSLLHVCLKPLGSSGAVTEQRVRKGLADAR